MVNFSIPILLLTSVIGCSLAGVVDNNSPRDSSDNSNTCVDYYECTCKNGRRFQAKFSRKAYENNIHENYKKFKQGLLDILESKKSRMNLIDLESPAIKLEQQLYQSCMKLGNETHENEEDNILYDINSLKDFYVPILKRFGGKKIDENVKWQEMVEELSELGLGNPFFDISVTRHPEDPNKNIILIQPPLRRNWDGFTENIILEMLHYIQGKTYKYCEKIGQLKSSIKNVTNDSVIESTCKSLQILQSIPENERFQTIVNKDSPSINLLRWLSKRITEILYSNDTDPQIQNRIPLHQKFTIKTWNETYNQFKESNRSEIDWTQIVKTEFKRAGITVDSNEEVFVRNQRYFKALANLFGVSWASNSSIVQLVYNIIVAQNIRYYDSRVVQKINSYDKSSFCFEQTGLYGLSDVVLKTVMKANLDPFIPLSKNYYYSISQNYFYSISQKIIDNIIQVFDSKISKVQGLTEAERTTLKFDLRDITQNVMDTKDTATDFSYDNIELTGDYLIDIHKYRRMMKNKILSSLRKNPSLSVTEPFSMNELHNNRNRFLFYTMLQANNRRPLYVHPFTGIYREAYYATFGVNIARFLHTLLIQEQHLNDFRDLRGSKALIPRNTFSSDVVKCFVPENIVAYGYQLAYSTIAEIFSVRIASEALKKDDNNLSIVQFYNLYLKTQCDVKSKMVKKVLSNLDELPEALNCSGATMTYPKCEMDISFSKPY